MKTYNIRITTPNGIAVDTEADLVRAIESFVKDNTPADEHGEVKAEIITEHLLLEATASQLKSLGDAHDGPQRSHEKVFVFSTPLDGVLCASDNQFQEERNILVDTTGQYMEIN